MIENLRERKRNIRDFLLLEGCTSITRENGAFYRLHSSIEFIRIMVIHMLNSESCSFT